MRSIAIQLGNSFPAIGVKRMPLLRIFYPFCCSYHSTNELVGGNDPCGRHLPFFLRARLATVNLARYDVMGYCQQLDRMEAEACTRFSHTRSAFEGMEIDLLASG